MASITVRNLDESLKRKLRLRAAEHSHSMEEEVRDILRRALGDRPELPNNLADRIRRRVEPFGGFELELPPRGPVPEPLDFS